MPLVHHVVRTVQKARGAARGRCRDRLAVHLYLPARTPPRRARIVDAVAHLDDYASLRHIDPGEAQFPTLSVAEPYVATDIHQNTSLGGHCRRQHQHDRLNLHVQLLLFTSAAQWSALSSSVNMRPFSVSLTEYG